MNTREIIYSSLADDEVLSEIVEMFVQEMPERVAKITEEFHAQNWDALRQTTHQLKGSAGSHGFADLSPAAGRVESLIMDDAPFEEIAKAVEALTEMCGRITSETPPST